MVVIVGVLLPYLVRIPRGAEWVSQYTNAGIFGFIFFGAFNAVAWGSIIVVSFLYHRVSSLLIPVTLAFGFLGYEHYTLDLRADAQSAIALVFIPFYALIFVAVGGLLGFVYDRVLR